MMSYMYLFPRNTLFYCEVALVPQYVTAACVNPSLTVSWILFSRI